MQMKTEEKKLRSTNGTCKTSRAPLKYQTYESWTVKNDKRCKLKALKTNLMK
jgi:hypothetical protein